MARASPLVAAHIAVDLNVLGNIPSHLFGYSKKWHCTNDSEFLSLINSKFPLPHQRSWQGLRLSFALSTKFISKLGTKESPMVGAPLIKFLPYIAKTQLSLPRGKNILSQRKASKSRMTTDASPSGSIIIAKLPISSYSKSDVAMQKFSVY